MEIVNGASIGKKLWDIVRIVLYMIRRNKVELNVLLMKGKKASKAIRNLIVHHHHHYAALTCRSADVNKSFVSPREYEFSCITPLHPSKRKNHHHHYHAEEFKLAEKDQPQVDKDAEEFIKKFYTELKKQKLYAATLESPSPYHEWAT